MSHVILFPLSLLLPHPNFLMTGLCSVTTAENGARALEFLGLATDEHNLQKGTVSNSYFEEKS